MCVLIEVASVVRLVIINMLAAFSKPHSVDCTQRFCKFASQLVTGCLQISLFNESKGLPKFNIKFLTVDSNVVSCWKAVCAIQILFKNISSSNDCN